MTGEKERYTTYSKLFVAIIFTLVLKLQLDGNLLLEGRGRHKRTAFIMTVYFELTSLPSPPEYRKAVEKLRQRLIGHVCGINKPGMKPNSID